MTEATTQTLVLTHDEGRISSVDDLEIVWETWRPKSPRGILLFVHGLAEHGGRYGYPIDYFTRKGFLCATVDLRGHGKSEGKRVHVERFSDYVADVKAVRALLNERHPELPIVQVGHSMGGLITVLDVLDNGAEMHAAIVSSPALGVPPNQEPGFLLRWIAAFLQRVAPSLLLPGIDSKAISRDPAIVAAYQQDPLVSNKISAGWLAQIRAAMADANARASELERPLLLMQSEKDQLVDPAASERWGQAAPQQWLTWKLWPDLFHEMFNEPERDEVFAFMLEWIEARLDNTAQAHSRHK